MTLKNKTSHTYSEHFLNVYLKNLTKLDIDWSFGPVIFSGDISKYWLNNKCKLWDAQIVPIYKAYLDNIKIIEQEIDFEYPIEQKNYEENNIHYIAKRKYQMDLMLQEIINVSNKVNN